jgi:hypothetical protein
VLEADEELEEDGGRVIFGLGSALKATPIERLAEEPAELDDVVVVEVPDDPAGGVKDMEVKVVAIFDTLLPGWFGIIGADEEVVVVVEAVEEANTVAIFDTFDPGTLGRGLGLCVGREPEADEEGKDPDTPDIRNILG